MTLMSLARTAVYRYPALFKTREGESAEKEEWGPTSAAPLSEQIGSLTAKSRTTTGPRAPFLSSLLLRG